MPIIAPLTPGDTIEAVIDTQGAQAGTRAVVMAVGWMPLDHGWQVRRVVARIVTPPRRGGTLAADIERGAWRGVPRHAGPAEIVPSFLSMAEPDGQREAA